MANYTVGKVMDLVGEQRTNLVIEYLRQMFLDMALFEFEHPVIDTSSVVSGTVAYSVPDNASIVSAVYLKDTADSNKYKRIPELVGDIDPNINTEAE